MIHKRELFLFVLALMLAAPAAGNIERAVEPSGNGLDITLTVTDFPVGGIVETLPDGCTWIETDHPADRTRVSGQHIAFAVIGEETIRYHVRGPSEAAERVAGTWEDYNTLAGASGTVGDDEPQTPKTETTQNSGVLTADAEAVPCDRNGDGTVTDSELATAILDSLDARFMGGTGEAPSVVDLQDAAFVIEHWKGKALTITDTAGRTTTVYRPLRRIVVFNGNHLRVMRSIGIESDRLVGVSQDVFKDPVYFQEYQGKSNVGLASSTNYEQIILLHPDAVILYLSHGSDLNDKIEKTIGSIEPNIHFFRFECWRPTTYVDEVRTLGLLLGKEEGANRFLKFYENAIDTVARGVERIPAEDRVEVYLEHGGGDYGTGGKASGYHEKIESAGGRNIFADNPTDYPVVSPEEVIIRNPDVIIKLMKDRGSYGDDDRSSFEMLRSSIMNRPGWIQINAVKDGRVHIIHNDLFGGADNFIGIAYLAKWFYPDLFPDLDPKAIHQQYLSEFQRLDYDLDEHGAFVYPT